MDNMKRGIATAFIASTFLAATPAFAQMYGGMGMYGYSNGYYPTTYQVTNVPTSIGYPVNIGSSYTPAYSGYMMPNQYAYLSQYQQHYQYGYMGNSYTYPPYNSSYAPYSNYYMTYPQDFGGYTGDQNALGSPLCYWQGYGRSDCSFDPHQWVYDPYSGTWY